MNEERSNTEYFVKAEFEERFRSMKSEMEMRQGELMEAQETIRKLEDQLRETQVAKDELEKQQRELHEMMQRLEESKNLEAEERARLESEIYQKRNEVKDYTSLFRMLRVFSKLYLYIHEQLNNLL